MIFRLAQELAARIAYTDAHAARLAEKLFAEAVRVSGRRSLGILLGQASFFYEQGHVHQALDILTPLVDRYPDSPKLLVEAAWCYFQLRRPELAEAQCRRAADISTARLKPMTPAQLREFHYFRGFAHWLIGQEELALRASRTRRFALSSGMRRSTSVTPCRRPS